MILYGWTREEWEVVLAWHNSLFPSEQLNFDQIAGTNPILLLGAQKAWLREGRSMTPRARQVGQLRDMTEKMLNYYGICQMTGDPELPWRHE